MSYQVQRGSSSQDWRAASAHRETVAQNTQSYSSRMGKNYPAKAANKTNAVAPQVMRDTRVAAPVSKPKAPVTQAPPAWTKPGVVLAAPALESPDVLQSIPGGIPTFASDSVTTITDDYELVTFAKITATISLKSDRKEQKDDSLITEPAALGASAAAMIRTALTHKPSPTEVAGPVIAWKLGTVKSTLSHLKLAGAGIPPTSAPAPVVAVEVPRPVGAPRGYDYLVDFFGPVQWMGKNIYKLEITDQNLQYLRFSQRSCSSFTQAKDGKPSVSLETMVEILKKNAFEPVGAIKVGRMDDELLTSFDNRRLASLFIAVSTSQIALTFFVDYSHFNTPLVNKINARFRDSEVLNSFSKGALKGSYGFGPSEILVIGGKYAGALSLAMSKGVPVKR